MSVRNLQWLVRGALVFGAMLAFGGCEPADEVAPAAPESAAAGAAQDTPPRLVVLVSIDTLRADHLGFLGHHRFTSPILDDFASQGVVFEDASTTAPWTLPAHVSILTGLYPNQHGVLSMDTGMPEHVQTLASLLAGRGFQTAAVVNSTWLRKEKYGVTRDFEKYLYVDDLQDRRAPNTWITEQAMTWIDEAGDAPLFLFVHYYDVHSDYASLPEYEKLFVTPYDGPVDGTGWQFIRANLEDDYLELCHKHYHPDKCRFGTVDKPLVVDSTVERLELDDADVQHLEELYDAGVRQLDTEISRLFTFLQDRNLEDQTLVVVTSDHGEEFMEHGRVDHFLTQYQEILHVPLIIRGPGIPAGKRVDLPVSVVDIAPTILSRLKVPIPSWMAGLDLAPLWSDEREVGGPPGVDPYRDRFIYGEASGGLTYDLVMKGIFPVYSAVRMGRFKMIHDSKAGAFVLYDLETDPGETHDVSAAHPEVAARLRKELSARHRGISGDAGPGTKVELDPEEIERLRALGYAVP